MPSLFKRSKIRCTLSGFLIIAASVNWNKSKCAPSATHWETSSMATLSVTSIISKRSIDCLAKIKLPSVRATNISNASRSIPKPLTFNLFCNQPGNWDGYTFGQSITIACFKSTFTHFACFVLFSSLPATATSKTSSGRLAIKFVIDSEPFFPGLELGIWISTNCLPPNRDWFLKQLSTSLQLNCPETL